MSDDEQKTQDDKPTNVVSGDGVSHPKEKELAKNEELDNSFIDTTTSIAMLQQGRNIESPDKDILDSSGKPIKKQKAAAKLSARGVETSDDIALVNAQGEKINITDELASGNIEVHLDGEKSEQANPDDNANIGEQASAGADVDSTSVDLAGKKEELKKRLGINNAENNTQEYSEYLESTSGSSINAVTLRKESEQDFLQLFEDLVEILADREKFFASLSDEDAELIANNNIPSVQEVVDAMGKALDEAGFPEIEGMKRSFLDYVKDHKGKLLSASSSVGLISSAYLGLEYGIDAVTELSKENPDSLLTAGSAINAVGYTAILPAKKTVDIFWGHSKSKAESDNEVVRSYLDEQEKFAEKFPHKMQEINEYLDRKGPQTSLSLMITTEVVTAVGHSLKAASGSIGDGIVAAARILAAGALTGISIAKYIKEDREDPNYDPELPNEKTIAKLGNKLAKEYNKNRNKVDSVLTGAGTVLLAAPSVILAASSAVGGDMTKAVAATGLALNYGVYMAVNAMDDPVVDVMSKQDTDLLIDIYYEAAKESLTGLVNNYEATQAIIGKNLSQISDTLAELAQHDNSVAKDKTSSQIINIDPEENLGRIINAVQGMADGIAERKFTRRSSPEIARYIAEKLDREFKTEIANGFIPVQDLKDGHFLNHADPIHQYVRALEADSADILKDGRVMVVYDHPRNLPSEVKKNWSLLKEFGRKKSKHFFQSPYASTKNERDYKPEVIHKSDMDQVGFVMSKNDLQLLVALSGDSLKYREAFEEDIGLKSLKKLANDVARIRESGKTKGQKKEIDNSFGEILDIVEKTISKDNPLYPENTRKNLNKAFGIIKSSNNDEEILSAFAGILQANGIDHITESGKTDSVILTYDSPADVPDRVIEAIDNIANLRGEFASEEEGQKVSLIMPEREIALLALMIKGKQSSQQLSDNGYKHLAKMLDDSLYEAVKNAINGLEQSEGRS